MARKSTPITVITHYPTTEEGRREFSKRAASVHAGWVNQTLKKLTCPSEQKLKLLDAVIDSVSSEKGREQAR